MAKEVGSVVANAVFNTEPFVRGAQQAEKSLQRFVNRSRRDFDKWAAGIDQKVGSAMKVLAVGLPAGLAALGAAQARAIDAQQKFADRIGTSQRQLVALQQAAAETAGVTDSTLNMALQRMTRRVAEAAQGTGEAKGAIAELGLDAAKLAQMDPAEQFRAISGAMQGVANQGDQLRLAFKLFDSEGASLVNTLRQGPEVLDQYVTLVDDLGLSLSRVDTAKVEAANDAFGRIGKVAQGLGNSIAVELSPFIKAIADQFVDASRESSGFRDAVREGVQIAGTAVAWFADILHGVEVAYAALRVSAEASGVVMLTIWTTIAKGVAGVVDHTIIPAFNAIIDGANAVNSVLGILDEELQHITPLAESPFIAGLEGALAGSQKRMEELFAEFNRIAMEPLPSEAVKAWLAEVQAAAEQAGQAVAAAAGGAPIGDGTSPIDPEAAEKAKGELSRVLGFGQSDMEKEQEAFARRLEILQENLALQNLTHEQFQRILEDQVQKHQQRLSAIEAKEQGKREKQEAASWAERSQNAFSELANMTAGVAQHSKLMFQINKAAAIASALLDAREAVTGAYKVGARIGGPPVGAAFAAVAAAAQAANVAAIASTSFDGGGSGTTPSAAGGGAVVNDIPVRADREILERDQNDTQRTIRIEVVGDDSEIGRVIARNIRQVVDDEDVVLIGPNSRQARELVA